MKRSKQKAKKVLAVFSAAALILSCGATGFVTRYSPIDTVVNAAENQVATQLRILDANGNDLGDNPIIYLDNIPAAGGKITDSFTVVASDDNGNPVDDDIRCFTDSDIDNYVYFKAPSISAERLQATVSGYNSEDSDGSPIKATKKTGTTHVSFTTSSGTVFRKVTIIVYQPATDMKVYSILDGKKNQFQVNDENMSNSASCMVIANHQYQFGAEKVPSGSTDEVEWYVYEGGAYEGQGTPSATTKAEITPSGLFTPKTNGEVTIMAKYKPTETSSRDNTMGSKKMTYYDSDGSKKTENLIVQTVPKYIHVIIVKENPAKNIQITNNPGAMEVNETIQLRYNATPSYTGSGYETGATDTFHWESSNPKVVTVDEKGLVKAVGKGEAKVIIYGENENVRAEADIKVLTKATSIDFDSQTISTRVDAETTITANMSPVSADEEIIWTSSDPSIATVESIVDGTFTNQQTAVVKGLKTGTITITAKAANSGVEKNITCTVNPRKASAEIKLFTLQGAQINPIYNATTVSVFDQKSITINGSLVSEDGTTPDDIIVWEVLDNGENNGDYVTIDKVTDSSITLTGFAKGVVRVKASSKANPTLFRYFNLEVLKKAAIGTILDAKTNSAPKYKAINVGGTISLTGDLMIETNHPYEHDDYIDHWESTNPRIFTVDNNGFVTAVGNGTATIKFVTKSGFTLGASFTAFTTSSVIIKGVTANPGAYSLPTTSINLDKKLTGTKTLSANIKNEKDSSVSCAVEWSSDNEDVATIDNTGKITAHNIGEAVITAKSGNKFDQCLVIVKYSLANATITVDNATYSPFASEYTPNVNVSYEKTTINEEGQAVKETVELIRGIDFDVTYSDNPLVNQSGTAVISGYDYYDNGTVAKIFKINPKNIKDEDIAISEITEQFELTAENKVTGIMPDIFVNNNGWPLEKDIDYSISYTNNKKPGTAHFQLTGKGNYTGKSELGDFEIFCPHNNFSEKTTSYSNCIIHGKLIKTCIVCGYQEEEELPLTDHNFRKTSTVQPTCTEDGYEYYTCSICGEEAPDKTVVLPAKGHTPSTPVKENTIKPTCTEEGSYEEVIYCTECDEELGRELKSIPATGHKNGPPERENEYDPTCTEDGSYDSVIYCSICGEEISRATIIIPAIDHNWGDWTSIGDRLVRICRNDPTHIEYKDIEVQYVRINKTTLDMNVGDNEVIEASAVPENATDKELKWESSDPAVARVIGGTVTALSQGTATITVSTKNGKSATCNITVKDPIVHPSKIKLSSTSVSVTIGSTKKLTATITPSDASDKTVIWKSANPSVVTVDNGTIKGISAGSTTITAATENGLTASCRVTVSKPTVAVTAVKLNKTSLSLEKGKTETLTAAITPTNATTKTVTWTSSNTTVATVSNGKITAKSVGTAKITAKSNNGKTATCTVTVKNPAVVATNIKLDFPSVTLGKGEEWTLKTTFSPSNTTNKTITWTTSNKNVATVSGGKIKAVNTGTATITAKTSNGKTAVCKVTVKNAPSKVTLSNGAITLGVGEKFSVSSTIPGGAAAAKRTYRTSNSSIVKMTRTNWVGEFTAQKVGVAYVTVRLYNGKEASCKVTVKAAPKSVTISKKAITLKVGKTASLGCTIPSNAGCAARTFRSSNSSIVKMTRTNWTGQFKAMKPGVAYVTVRLYNGKESSCKVTVVK